MKTIFFLFIILSLGFKSCNTHKKTHVDKKDFSQNIMFNHLYVVLDDSTYKYLIDSLKVLGDFSVNRERTFDDGDNSWFQRTMWGKNNYLEIFHPGGGWNRKFGQFGIAFMTNKSGTMDSVQKYWSADTDSIMISRRLTQDGKSNPWYRSLKIPNSLLIIPWLMEHEKEHMYSKGFTDQDLLNNIEYWDYLRYFRGTLYGISPDSVQFKKAFDKVTSINLTLSEAELSLLRQYLKAFGFNEKTKTFTCNDMVIKYSISNSEHFILNQIDFNLLYSLPNGKYQYRNIEFNVVGNKASLKFMYNKEIQGDNL